MLELRDVTRAYLQGGRLVPALRGITLQIRAGEFLAIMGPSGSGKSTLLNLLGTLDQPTTGQVVFEERDSQLLSDRERSRLRRDRIGFIFQFFNLLPTLTAAENVALPRLLAGRSRKQARRCASERLEQVGLIGRMDHFPEQLSGGEMQRVAIARALVMEPALLLCDEPTGNLDTAGAAAILRLLRDLPESSRRAVVMVTHDRRVAEHADRLICLRDGQIESEETLRGRHESAVLVA